MHMTNNIYAERPDNRKKIHRTFSRDHKMFETNAQNDRQKSNTKNEKEGEDEKIRLYIFGINANEIRKR